MTDQFRHLTQEQLRAKLVEDHGEGVARVMDKIVASDPPTNGPKPEKAQRVGVKAKARPALTSKATGEPWQGNYGPLPRSGAGPLRKQFPHDRNKSNRRKNQNNNSDPDSL